MVEVWIARPFRQARSAREQHDGRAFGVGAGDGVDRIQSSDTIGDAERPDPVDARIGIRRESGAVFACGSDVLDRGGFNELV